jgi:hypothetical protein
MARITQHSQAEEAAARQQELANADRNRQDTEEREVLTRLFLAKRRRDEATKNLEAAESDMARELEKLFDMGNSMDRVLILTGETNKDTIRKIRKVKTSTAANADAARPTTTSNGRVPETLAAGGTG